MEVKIHSEEGDSETDTECDASSEEGEAIVFCLIIDNTPINRQFPNIKQFHTISYFMMQI